MAITLALIPVFLIIVIGQILRRVDFPGMSFWAPAEKLLYYVLFPCMLIEKLTYAAHDDALFSALGVAILLAIALATLILTGIQKIRPVSGARFTSIYQGGIRFNSYIGLAAIQATIGESAISTAAICMAIMIPLINVLSILAFSLYAPGGTPGWRNVFLNVIKNPLILGCVAGISFNRLGVDFPAPIDDVLHHIGSMALPLGLLCVGAALDLSKIGQGSGALAWALAFKLAVMPLLFCVSARLAGLDAGSTQVLLTLGALPTATASYILARQLGGEAPLMATIISAQTLVGMVSMPVIIPLLLPLTT
ncbi:MAG: AEC family transporter [Hahellaceae bacterium]|nr:AEC family transporter [Hahellaceae bacterium]